jgi:hypothetical protein
VETVPEPLTIVVSVETGVVKVEMIAMTGAETAEEVAVPMKTGAAVLLAVVPTEDKAQDKERKDNIH